MVVFLRDVEERNRLVDDVKFIVVDEERCACFLVAKPEKERDSRGKPTAFVTQTL